MFREKNASRASSTISHTRSRHLLDLGQQRVLLRVRLVISRSDSQTFVAWSPIRSSCEVMWVATSR